jgi:transposase, IS5 family
VAKKIWNELQKQLDAMKLKVKKGIMQDASSMTSDPGHAKSYTSRRNNAKTQRSKDGIWAKRERNPILDTSFMVPWMRI